MLTKVLAAGLPPPLFRQVAGQSGEENEIFSLSASFWLQTS
jgi:hypothetical protein